jgi:hypothetical protein
MPDDKPDFGGMSESVKKTCDPSRNRTKVEGLMLWTLYIGLWIAAIGLIVPTSMFFFTSVITHICTFAPPQNEVPDNKKILCPCASCANFPTESEKPQTVTVSRNENGFIDTKTKVSEAENKGQFPFRCKEICDILNFNKPVKYFDYIDLILVTSVLVICSISLIATISKPPASIGTKPVDVKEVLREYLEVIHKLEKPILSIIIVTLCIKLFSILVLEVLGEDSNQENKHKEVVVLYKSISVCITIFVITIYTYLNRKHKTEN